MKTLSDYTEEDNKLPPNHFPSQPAMVRFLNDLAQQVADLQEVIKAHHSVGWTPISRDCKVCQN